MSSNPDRYDWNTYMRNGSLSQKEPSINGDSQLPTLSIAGMTYDDAPREMLYTQLLTEFKQNLTQLPENYQKQVIAQLESFRKEGLSWIALQAIQDQIVNVLSELVTRGYISEAHLSAGLREKLMEARQNKSPSEIPQQRVWNSPKPRPGH